MKTVGLDIATTTGMALVGEDEDRGKTIQLPQQRGFERLQLIADEVARTLAIWQPDFVMVEGYAYCKNIHSFTVLVEVGTVIRQVLHSGQYPWAEVPPTTLKKWVTNCGNAKKEQMALCAKERWGFESPSHDIVDAYCLAQMAQAGCLRKESLHDIAGVVFSPQGERFYLDKLSTPL